MQSADHRRVLNKIGELYEKAGLAVISKEIHNPTTCKLCNGYGAVPEDVDYLFKEVLRECIHLSDTEVDSSSDDPQMTPREVIPSGGKALGWIPYQQPAGSEDAMMTCWRSDLGGCASALPEALSPTDSSMPEALSSTDSSMPELVWPEMRESPVIFSDQVPIYRHWTEPFIISDQIRSHYHLWSGDHSCM